MNTSKQWTKATPKRRNILIPNTYTIELVWTLSFNLVY